MPAAPETDEQPTTVKIEKGNQAIELVAEQLEQLVDAAEKLTAGGLTDRAIVLLLHDRTEVGKRDIAAVLQALPELRVYLRSR